MLGAQTQGMIGYFLLQALENALPSKEVVSLVCQTLVDADDPAFAEPTKFVGPVYAQQEAEQLACSRGWQVRRDGNEWRRVVASPEPAALVEMGTIERLVARGATVVCAGGGGVPVTRGEDGLLHGVEAVVDKDLTASMLACGIGAEALMLLTDVECVESDFGSESARPIRKTTPSTLRAQDFASGSMGPKVEAACRFVESTGHKAMIGRLDEAAELLAGNVGTLVESDTIESARGER